MANAAVHAVATRIDPKRALPAPERHGGMTLAAALASRRSRREYSPGALPAEQVSQICWAAQGLTSQDGGYRTAPSAGALYPLSVYVADADGIWRYVPGGHCLALVASGDVRLQLQRAALDQPSVGSAPVCLIVAMDPRISIPRYGQRSERYCLLEAGHVVQNVLLQATALGLAAVPVGAFEERMVSTVARLPGHARPVYLVPVGQPAT
jgi:SagB-type dehydrogenase family enzyme